MRFAAAIFFVFVVFAGGAPARAASTALVLAIDVSESVTEQSYILQHEGIARAFENKALIDAIARQPGGIEVMVLEWSDPDKIATTVGWSKITDAASGAAFAAKVRKTTRTSYGLTAIGAAMLAAAAAFDRLPEPAARRVIDISGDGIANFGADPATVRDGLVKQGITINGLAIIGEEPALESYYRHYVIGGDAAFVLVAKNFDSFAEAMLRKMVEEVAWLAPARR